jgi:hypothetical protein
VVKISSLKNEDILQYSKGSRDKGDEEDEGDKEVMLKIYFFSCFSPSSPPTPQNKVEGF